MKYIKKPIAIEAIQWDGSNTKDILKFMGQSVNLVSDTAQERFYEYCCSVRKNGMDIKTLEDGVDDRSKHVASVGDYIIKGIQGEFYPCKPDIFESSYFTEQEYAEYIT